MRTGLLVLTIALLPLFCQVCNALHLPDDDHGSFLSGGQWLDFFLYGCLLDSEGNFYDYGGISGVAGAFIFGSDGASESLMLSVPRRLPQDFEEAGKDTEMVISGLKTDKLIAEYVAEMKKLHNHAVESLKEGNQNMVLVYSEKLPMYYDSCLAVTRDNFGQNIFGWGAPLASGLGVAGVSAASLPMALGAQGLGVLKALFYSGGVVAEAFFIPLECLYDGVDVLGASVVNYGWASLQPLLIPASFAFGTAEAALNVAMITPLSFLVSPPKPDVTTKANVKRNGRLVKCFDLDFCRTNFVAGACSEADMELVKKVLASNRKITELLTCIDSTSGRLPDIDGEKQRREANIDDGFHNGLYDSEGYNNAKRELENWYKSALDRNYEQVNDCNASLARLLLCHKEMKERCLAASRQERIEMMRFLYDTAGCRRLVVSEDSPVRDSAFLLEVNVKKILEKEAF